ncbi:prepilin-type N-terminal cleavage/methylation domain-containing protein [Exiguobacterium sp. s46]|uniref:type II secretion system protein n=1 Tax=Exiguobacterium sp. s46 TaxID=2751200 RepID=UPI001BE91D6E|nr:prepilin-type N-terminal cleavage/methylation domain-containing protein [Exiguobacterium sp. s46]
MVERLKEIWLDAKQMRDERGLTLIELLVVVVILGIIAAIAVVAIGGLIENSRKDAQVSNAKQLVSAAKLYASQNPIASGETVEVGLRKGSADIADTPATTGTNATNKLASLDKFVDSLKDPMDDDATYKNAYVKIVEASGKYTYTVYLEGKKVYFNGAAPDTLKRSAIN